MAGSSLNRRLRSLRRAAQTWLRPPAAPYLVPDVAAFWLELQRQAPDLYKCATQFQHIREGERFHFILVFQPVLYGQSYRIMSVITPDQLKMMRDPAEEIVGELVYQYQSWTEQAN
jgi:hypothetical protein